MMKMKSQCHTVPCDTISYRQYFTNEVNISLFSNLGEYVIGRVIKAMKANWHPDCFRCEICNDQLADTGFIKNAGRLVKLKHSLCDRKQTLQAILTAEPRSLSTN